MKTKMNARKSCLLVILGLLFVSVSLAASPAKAETQINLNTATEQELTTLPGIGAATAQNIIAARPFKSVEDLQKVKGIGEARYNIIKNRVTVAAAATRPATPAARATRAPTTTTGPININTADQKTLESLPGIGPATAQSIIAARPFKTIEELQNVKGIGKAKYESLKDKVTVESGGRVRPAPATRTPAPAVESRKPGAATTQPPAGREIKPAIPAGPIDINTADLKTLESLPGIGPVKAQAIIDHRPYTKIEDIMKVPGIKEGTFAKIKDTIVVK